MIAIFGSLIGFIASILPELINKYYNYKQSDRDNEHERLLFDKQLSFMKLRSQYKLDEVALEANAQEKVALYNSIRPTNVKWVDGLSGVVRPFITIICFGTYVSYKIIFILAYLGVAKSHSTFIMADWLTLSKVVFSETDEGILSVIMSFWFGQRAITRKHLI